MQEVLTECTNFVITNTLIIIVYKKSLTMTLEKIKKESSHTNNII